GVGEFIGAGKAAAQRAVGADEIGVAELTCGSGAVLLAAAPEIAAGEPAEYRRPPGMGAFALQGQKYLFDGVAHPVSFTSPVQALFWRMILSETRSPLFRIMRYASAATPRRWRSPLPSRH